MSKLTRFQKIVIGCIAFFMILGFVFRGIAGNNTLDSIPFDTLAMLRYSLLEQPVRTVKGWFDDFGALWSVKEENDQLKIELSKQPLLQSELDEAKTKLKEYEEMMNLSSSLDQYEKLYANVLVRDQSLWNNILTIDKGASDNISKDMAVMSSTGMIGKIYEVGEYASKVKLLTSQDKLNNVSIKINMEDRDSEGILERYDVDSGYFIIHLFNNNDEIKKDMKVVSSGQGGLYPAGLLIGSVAKVESLSNQIGKTVYVKPAADFSSFQTVMIINKKEGEQQ